MRQAYRIIPIYTADVSGVCSALYELGGMTVMHDPSGCNSTYNTHDEIRWYDQDSLIFISGLTDIDAIMGNDEKFLRDIRETAGELKPNFIALASSPIPFMNGTDFPGLARALETETGIPAFAVPTSGMHDYVYGAGLALGEIAKRFPMSGEEKGTQHTGPGSDETVVQGGRKRLKINLLGVTPLDFGPRKFVDDMKKRLEEKGVEILSVWAMGDTLEDLARAGEADANLVVSSLGIPAANILKKRFRTPFLVGTPVEGTEEEICRALKEVCRDRSGEKTEIPKNDEKSDENIFGVDKDLWKVTSGQILYFRNRQMAFEKNDCPPEITVIGEPVTMGSLAAVIEEKYEKKVRLLCPLEITGGLLRKGDEAVSGEEAMEEKLKNAKIILADPLYRPICPEMAEFYELPHIAFSGRICLKNMHNFMKTT